MLFLECSYIVRIIRKLVPKFNFSEFLLGISLGTGYMTSLRFFGPLGISELLMLVFIILLAIKNGRSTFLFPKNEYGRIKLFMYLSVGFILPITTLIFYFSGKAGSEPVYIISFVAGCLLAFMLAETVEVKICMNNTTLWFALAFIFSNIIFSQFNPDSLTEARYMGAAKNPNQLVFYATSLTLLLVIYNKFAAIVFVPLILYFMLKVGSDAYILSLVVSIFCFFVLYFYFKLKLGFKLNLILILFGLIFLLAFAFYFYSESLSAIWLDADEGHTRTTLMYNGLIESLKSPFFGYGAGSFSYFGIMTVENAKAEAHNTFLDLSMQFGFLYPIFIYYIFIRYFIFKFKRRLALDCAFFIAFIISGLFHFSGRHFVFWVELGVFMNFIYFKNQSKKLVVVNKS